MTHQLQNREPMAVQSSARLRLAVNGSFPEFDYRFGGGMMKGFGERSVLTERRRALIGDIGGARRPINFLQTAATGRRNMHKLRRLERKVLFVHGLRDSIWSFLTAFERWNPLRSYGDQLRYGCR